MNSWPVQTLSLVVASLDSTLTLVLSLAALRESSLSGSYAVLLRLRAFSLSRTSSLSEREVSLRLSVLFTKLDFEDSRCLVPLSSLILDLVMDLCKLVCIRLRPPPDGWLSVRVRSYCFSFSYSCSYFFALLSLFRFLKRRKMQITIRKKAMIPMKIEAYDKFSSGLSEMGKQLENRYGLIFLFFSIP